MITRASRFLWAQSHQESGPNKTYIYYWNHPWPGPNKDIYGAFHASEIPYVMDSLWVSKLPLSNQDYEIGDMMSSYWVNFAATGNPNGNALPAWPAFSPDSKVEMQLGDHTGVIPVAPAAKFDFFKQFFDDFAHLNIVYRSEFKEYKEVRDR